MFVHRPRRWSNLELSFERNLLLAKADIGVHSVSVPQLTLSFVILSHVIRLTNDILMLDHRLQLSPNINSAFAQRIVTKTYNKKSRGSKGSRGAY